MTSVSPSPAIPSPLSALQPLAQNPRSSGRRPSWILNIGAKLSSLSSSSSSSAPADVEHAAIPPANRATASAVSVSVDGTTSRPPKDSVQSLAEALSSGPPSPSRPSLTFPISPSEAPNSTVSPLQASSPSSNSASSFFSSAFKRLSSPRAFSTSAGGGAGCSGGRVPRRVLNVNPGRVQCTVPELGNAAHLRRVSFCVDVKIAGPPAWPAGVLPGDGRVSREDDLCLTAPQTLTTSEHGSEQDTTAEAAAISSADPVANFPSSPKPKDKEKRSKGTAHKRASSAPGECTCAMNEPTLSASPFSARRWRKSRSSSLSAPAEAGPCKACLSSLEPDSVEDIPPSPINIDGLALPTQRVIQEILVEDSNSRPTTDPLRIYRRCCQLRETPVLKRIADQLSALRSQLQTNQREGEKPGALHLSAPPVVPVLDLSNSCLQHGDFVTLADWLAIVPVRRLVLENADIRGDALKAVLSGLLAVRHFRSDTGSDEKGTGVGAGGDMSGVIESLNLCRNRHLTVAAWKDISLFIYLCTSLKVLDLSYIPFPLCPNMSASKPDQAVVPALSSSPVASPTKGGKHGRHHSRTMSADAHKPIATPAPRSPNTVEVFAKALCSRRGGSTLEEIRLGNCGLTSSVVRKIVDAAILCGVHRISLAGNKLDAVGLQYVVQYAQSGVCQGLDLAANDLRPYVPLLADCFRDLARKSPRSPLWALCLARCNLDARSLHELMPELSRLPNLRFLDLSHNKRLMTTPQSAGALAATSGCMNPGLAALRRWLPQCKMLRRLHLADIGLTPAQAMALVDIVPDTPMIGLLDIQDNAALTALANAETDTDREEAYALFASVAAAARASRSILRIDMALPSAQNGEVVKALARQAAAACLRNVGRYTEAVVDGDQLSHVAKLQRHNRHRRRQRRAMRKDGGKGRGSADGKAQKEKGDGIFDEARQHTQSDSVIGPAFAVGRYSEAGPSPAATLPHCPELVFDSDSREDDLEDGGPLSDSDYVSDSSIQADNLAIRAPGVARALNFFLSDDIRHEGVQADDSATPRAANEMTKNLLASARRIRARLQLSLRQAADDSGNPTGVKQDHSGRTAVDASGLSTSDFVFKRLQFLDSTLDQMIERFESEFPECRLVSKPTTTGADVPAPRTVPSSICTPRQSTASLSSQASDGASVTSSEGPMPELAVPNEEDDSAMSVLRNRRNQSDVSLAGRELMSEEGRVHRISILHHQAKNPTPPMDDDLEGATVVSTDGEDDDVATGVMMTTGKGGCCRGAEVEASPSVSIPSRPGTAESAIITRTSTL